MAVQDLIQRRRGRCGIHRFGDVFVHSSREAALAITSHGVRGHGDDWNSRAPGARPSTHFGRGVDALQAGHLDVHDMDETSAGAAASSKKDHAQNAGCRDCSTGAGVGA